MNSNVLNTINQHLLVGGHLRLFLDYDGTLVPIARTPAEARPDAGLKVLLASLAEAPQLWITILSGRPLASLVEMLPIPGLTLAGTYGLEIQWSDGQITQRTQPEEIRPVIKRILSVWAAMVGPRPGFLLEDKGIAVALHARFAEPRDVREIWPKALAAAQQILDPTRFRILGGDRFMEAAPALAHKGQTVDWLLAETRAFEALLIYLGDDDKDEEAFEVVKHRGGIPIRVGPPSSATQALARLPTTDSVREWLQMLRATLADHRLRLLNGQFTRPIQTGRGRK